MEKQYFIPEVTKDELKERNEIRTKRRVTGVATGLASAFTLYLLAQIGLRMDEIVENPVVNNVFNIFLGAMGTMSVLGTIVYIRIFKELSQELKEKNKKIRHSIYKYFDKQLEKITKVELKEKNENEEYLEILQIHNDLLNDKRNCLKQYGVETAYDEEMYNNNISTVHKLQSQYENYENDLKLSRINPSEAGK